jgi:membrane-associated phospholipid phosphatase
MNQPVAVRSEKKRPLVTRRALRLAPALGGALGIAVLLPVLQPLDDATFLAVNGLGDGPEWIYGAFDPHNRNYLVLAIGTVAADVMVRRRARRLWRAAITLLLAAGLSMLALELIQLVVDRPRPEEMLGARAELTHDREWASIASFPSGHMVVTAALVAAAARIAPALRPILLLYLAAVGVTRVLFGAHFPLDVLVGTAVGYQVGGVAASLACSCEAEPAATRS